jgi:hypothetical protein
VTHNLELARMMPRTLKMIDGRLTAVCPLADATVSRRCGRRRMAARDRGGWPRSRRPWSRPSPSRRRPALARMTGRRRPVTEVTIPRLAGRPIDRIQFRGNRKVESDTIRLNLVSKVGATIDAAKIRDDVRRCGG